MLGRLPHTTLLPAHPSTGRTPKDGSQITPPHTASWRWKTNHRPTNTSDFSPVLPCSGSNSPSRSSTFLPFLKFRTERSISPEPVFPDEAAEFEHTLSGGKSLEAKPDTKPGKLANWFSGSSEPVNITLIPSPTKEKHSHFFDSAEMEKGFTRSSMSGEVDSMTKGPQRRLEKRNSGLSVAAKDQPGSRFAFWRARPSINSDKFDVVEDELLGSDIQTALFPSGMIDASSPEAFKKLQANAEHTIRQLQTAYQNSLRSFQEVTSEKNVLTDELEAAQTQSEHLKMQLANMAAQSVQQESAMQLMAGELAAVRHKMRQDAAFRSKSLRIVANESSDAEIVESVGHSRLRRDRHSAGSFDSENSSRDSIFSHTAPGTCTPISAADTSPDTYGTLRFEAVGLEHAKECQNCHGVDRSEAWDVVHMLKEESRALKAHVAQYESANEDALSLLEVVSVVP
jgi:hypothetical protein